MMYCCGMRPQEVLNLKTIDVDLAFGDIYIRKTKSYRDRHIIMSSDMLDLCHRYIMIIFLISQMEKDIHQMIYIIVSSILKRKPDLISQILDLIASGTCLPLKI